MHHIEPFALCHGVPAVVAAVVVAGVIDDDVYVFDFVVGVTVVVGHHVHTCAFTCNHVLSCDTILQRLQDFLLYLCIYGNSLHIAA